MLASNVRAERYASLERLRKLKKLVRLGRNRRFRSALRQGVAAGVEHYDVPFGPQFRTVIDVGAHHGQFALFALERYPGATLWCLEPLPAARARLEGVLGNSAAVRILPFAADAWAGTRALHVSRLDDSSSLRPILDRYTAAFPGTEEAGTLSVQAERLDEIVSLADLVAPTLLKIDVQGHELDVLRGARALLPAVAEVYVECSFLQLYGCQPLAGEVIAHLVAEDFALAGVFGLKRDRVGRCLQADLLFSRSA